jgi:hypothetical protein
MGLPTPALLILFLISVNQRLKKLYFKKLFINQVQMNLAHVVKKNTAFCLALASLVCCPTGRCEPNLTVKKRS